MYILIALLIVAIGFASMGCMGWLHVRGWDPQWWNVCCLLFALWVVSEIEMAMEDSRK